MKRRKKPYFTGAEWTVPMIEKGWDIINNIAKKKYGWEGYPVQFEIVSSLQMLDSYAVVGMPVFYSHWSFGKEQIRAQEEYEAGLSRGLAYEMVLNTSPSVCYIMEDNNMMMQLLVSAHAAVGHNHFFKNNYLFKDWTQPELMVDYLLYAKHFISDCTEKYGKDVETTIDIAHYFGEYSSIKYHRVHKTRDELAASKKAVRDELYKAYNPVLDGEFKDYRKRTVYKRREDVKSSESFLEFFENTNDYDTVLEDWQKEIFHIVRNIEQYFYPQRLTKLMNEGFASYCHHTLMHDLYDEGYIDDGYMLDFTHSHCGVLYQPDSGSKEGWNSINPYALGFAMFKDIERICKNPTAEDIEFLPQFANTDHVETIKYIVANYRDESFIREFLSPAMIRKFKLFAVDTFDEKAITINSTQNSEDYDVIRNKLAQQYAYETSIPDIDIKTGRDYVEWQKHLQGLYEEAGVNVGNLYKPSPDGDSQYMSVLISDYFGNRFTDESLYILYKYIKSIWKHSVMIVVTLQNGNILFSEADADRFEEGG